MTCDCCAARREAPLHNAYNPACAWCGARIIQAIRSRVGQVPREERSLRASAELAHWVKWGHDEALIRSLVRTNDLLEPEATGKRG